MREGDGKVVVAVYLGGHVVVAVVVMNGFVRWLVVVIVMVC